MKKKIKSFYTKNLKVGRTTYIYVVELSSEVGLIPPPELTFYYGPPTDCWAVFEYSGDGQEGIAKRYRMTQQAVSRAIERASAFPFHEHYKYRFEEWKAERERLDKLLPKPTEKGGEA